MNWLLHIITVAPWIIFSIWLWLIAINYLATLIIGKRPRPW